jgi:hypothetical protein
MPAIKLFTVTQYKPNDERQELLLALRDGKLSDSLSHNVSRNIGSQIGGDK